MIRFERITGEIIILFKEREDKWPDKVLMENNGECKQSPQIISSLFAFHTKSSDSALIAASPRGMCGSILLCSSSSPASLLSRQGARDGSAYPVHDDAVAAVRHRNRPVLAHEIAVETLHVFRDSRMLLFQGDSLRHAARKIFSLLSRPRIQLAGRSYSKRNLAFHLTRGWNYRSSNK